MLWPSAPVLLSDFVAHNSRVQIFFNHCVEMLLAHTHGTASDCTWWGRHIYLVHTTSNGFWNRWCHLCHLDLLFKYWNFTGLVGMPLHRTISRAPEGAPLCTTCFKEVKCITEKNVGPSSCCLVKNELVPSVAFSGRPLFICTFFLFLTPWINIGATFL